MTIDSDVTNELFLVNPARVYTYVIENSGLDDLTVYEVNAEGLQTIVINYNNVLDGVGPPLWDGGTITFSSAHLADTVSVEVQRTTTITQLIDYQAYDAFPAETHEFGLDKLTMITQESRDLIDWLLGDPFGGSGGIPITSPFIPLAGTQVTKPITGTLVFDHNDTGPSWTQNQGDLFGINAMIFNGSGVNSEFFITTVDALGNGNQFRFSGDGEFFIPSQLAGNNEAWVIKGVDFYGTSNALSIFSFDSDTGLRTSNPLILYSSATEFFYHGEDGKILTSGVVTAGDNDQILTTKLYVDGVVAGIGGLPSEVAGNMLVGTGAGWGVATGITLDTVATPGQADLTLGGKFILANTHADHLLESWEVFTGDISGANWMQIAPSTAVGAFSIYTDSALTENFGFAGGFLSLPKLPTSNTHAASKKYVDDRLPAGGSLNDTLRWNGSDWLANANLQINAAGDVAMSQALEVTGVTTFTGAVVLSSGMLMTIPTGAGGNNNEFLSIDVNGFLQKSDYNPSSFAATADVVLKTGVQSIAGHKTFTDTNTTIQNLDVVTNLAIGTHLGVDKVLYSNNLGILVEASFSPADVVLNTLNLTAGDGISGGGTLAANRSFDVDSTVLRTTGAQSIAGHKTFTDTNTSVQNLDVVGNIAAQSLFPSGNLTECGANGVLVPSAKKVGDFPLKTLNLTAGDGLSGGGTLSANRSFAVDSTVVRTSGTQTLSGALNVPSLAATGNIGSTALTSPGLVYSNFLGILTNTNPSDRNIKHDIDYLPYGLNEIMGLTPRQFVYNGGDGSLSYGFIAQEMQKVLPNFVVDTGEHLGIKGDIVPILVNGIKEQQANIDTLIARLDALEAKVIAMGGDI